MKRYGFQRYAMKNHLRYGLVIAGVFCLIVIALIVGGLRPKRASGAAMQAPPVILVAQVEQQDVPIYGGWIGTLAGQVNANVQAQVSGYLLERDYQEGSTVRA
jgi:multidrug efflux pump subunit AcrA (membrane-fusion protein)